MTTNRMGLEQEDDYGLSAQLEALEAMIEPGDTENQQLICLLLELKRRRATAALDEAQRAELLAYRKASKEPVAYADPIALQGFSNFREHPGSDINIRGREWMWSNADSGLLPLYAAPPLQAVTVPDEVTFDQAMLMAYGLTPAEAFQKAWSHLRGIILKSVTNEP